MGLPNRTNMGDPASDFNSLVGPYTIGGGIYDFSGTQENHVYHENQGPANSMKTGVSKAEIADWTRLWWDGQSDARTSPTHSSWLLAESNTVSCAVQLLARVTNSTSSSAAPRTRRPRLDV